MRAGRALAIAVGTGAALAAACSMRSPKQQASMAPWSTGQDPHQEITARWDAIRQARQGAQLASDPDPDTVSAMSALPASEAATTCEAPAPTAGTCGDVCQLGDAICDNAVAICRIADQLAGDVWAHGKCDSAKASCHEAAARCCACRRPGLGMP